MLRDRLDIPLIVLRGKTRVYLRFLNDSISTSILHVLLLLVMCGVCHCVVSRLIWVVINVIMYVCEALPLIMSGLH